MIEKKERSYITFKYAVGEVAQTICKRMLCVKPEERITTEELSLMFRLAGDNDNERARATHAARLKKSENERERRGIR